jgi:hypothetical protein
MRELNVNEIKEVSGGSRLLRALRWLAVELAPHATGPDRYSGGWRP